MKTLVCMVVLCTISAGCSMGPAADWDGTATGNTELIFIASYADSVHLKSVHLAITAGQDAGDIAAMLETAWNADGVAEGFRASADGSVLCFPNNVTDMKVIDSSFADHDLTSTAVTVGPGISVKESNAACAEW